jgi:hypothetical protein
VADRGRDAHVPGHAIIDANGMPAGAPLYTPPGPVRRAPLTVACPAPASAPNGVCGDYVVLTMLPPFEPFQPFQPAALSGSAMQQIPQLRVPQTNPMIGDRLTAKGIDWAWYSGGWSNANGNVGGPGWTNGTTLGTCAAKCLALYRSLGFRASRRAPGPALSASTTIVSAL